MPDLKTQIPEEKAALAWLYSTQLFGIKLGLDPTRELLKRLDLPAPGQKYFHVAGTNGKGSVCAFLHSLLTAANVRAGLFTSPHLISFRERIRDDERMISSEEVAAGISVLQGFCKDWEQHPTFFELTFALAMDWFRKRQNDWVVLETGMGGRLDSTNTILPEVCVITSISLDHEQALGKTLREIAAEKAGIIKPGVPVVTVEQVPEVMNVISETARERGSALKIVTTPLSGYQIGLAGEHQLWNATLAVEAFKLAGFKTSEAVLNAGLSKVTWPARFQRFEKERVILDGAHNPAAAETLVRTWQQTFPGKKASLIFGGVKDKDLRTVIEALQPIAARWHFTSFESPRAASPEELQEILISLLGSNVVSSRHARIEAALRHAQTFEENVVIAGSLYLAGETLAFLQNEPENFQTSLQ